MRQTNKVAVCIAGISLAAILGGCAAQPSPNEILDAINAGTMTAQDAMDKGWVDQAWVNENFPPITAGTKEHAVTPFTTTFTDGSEATQDVAAGNRLLVFADAAHPDFTATLNGLKEVHARLDDADIPMTVFVVNHDKAPADVDLGSTGFPLVVYNDEADAAFGALGMLAEVKEALGEAPTMTATFTKNGSVYSSWLVNPTADDLIDLAHTTADALAGEEDAGAPEDGDAAGMAAGAIQ